MRSDQGDRTAQSRKPPGGDRLRRFRERLGRGIRLQQDGRDRRDSSVREYQHADLEQPSQRSRRSGPETPYGQPSGRRARSSASPANRERTSVMPDPIDPSTTASGTVGGHVVAQNGDNQTAVELLTNTPCNVRSRRQPPRLKPRTTSSRTRTRQCAADHRRPSTRAMPSGRCRPRSRCSSRGTTAALPARG